MNELTFDAFARRAAPVVSRRASLLTLGTVGLTALVAPIPAAAESKTKKPKKNKSDKKDKRRCRQTLAECTAQAEQCAEQVESCIRFITPICAGDPNCLAQLGLCCDYLERRDASEFILCLVYY